MCSSDLALSDAAKQRIAAQFDKEFVPTRPLTPAQRKLWKKAKRKSGRPKVGEGAKIVSVGIERGLLRRADALAKQRNVSRSELFAQALHAALSRGKDQTRRGLRQDPHRTLERAG